MPCAARRPKMWPMMGVSTTGARGFGISPVKGKRRVPLPAASAIAFIFCLPFPALVSPRVPALPPLVLNRQARLQPAPPCSIFIPVHDGTLHRLFPSAKFDEPLRRYTAWKIGGPADALIEPKSTDELVAAVRQARSNGVPVTVLGGGTNVLVRDGGSRGRPIRRGTRPT